MYWIMQEVLILGGGVLFELLYLTLHLNSDSAICEC